MSHCCRFQPTALTRRQMLASCMSGFGAVAFTALAGDSFATGALGAGAQGAPLSGDRQGRTLHHRARARNVIFLYMDGGPSQVDTFDPKPALAEWHGKPFPMAMEATQFNNNGNTLAGPWAFRPRGTCGTPVSDLFPHVGECADDLLVVRSMTSTFSEHTNANYFLHTGLGMAGRPSMGAWTSYGLGSASNDLPGFMVLNGGLIPPGGIECLGAGFLPATHQASIMRPEGEGIPCCRPPAGRADDSAAREMAAVLDRDFALRTGAGSVESAIENAELAFRMQSAVPELMDISGESAEVRALYGLDHADAGTRTYARQCLLARRLVERGVRFVELTCPGLGHDRWDQHDNLVKGHSDNARAVDQPIAGLLKDLKRRGLLDETLVVWGGEFGRTPFAQGTNGRDHNPFGFSMWLAGGGIRGGSVYGETDEFGYKVVDKPVEIHDLHATMLHLLGLDHTRLTYLFGGRQMRLTDVHGTVRNEWIAG